MDTPKQYSDGFISAVFSYEFVDDDVIERRCDRRIHRGEVDDWIVDVAGSGIFSKAEVCAIAQGWRSDPTSLIDALLVNVDEVTVKRCEVAWADLDRVASPAQDAMPELNRTLPGTILEAVKSPRHGHPTPQRYGFSARIRPMPDSGAQRPNAMPLRSVHASP